MDKDYVFRTLNEVVGDNKVPWEDNDDTKAEVTGKKFAEILGLKPAHANSMGKVTYNTAWGSKTAVGIYYMVLRLAEENHEVSV